jgi:hypothetical protein
MIRSINEQQFNNVVNKIYEEELIRYKWNTFTESEKKFVIHFTNATSEKRNYTLKEAKWYNTVGDVVGVFDPTGAVDAVNAVSYFKQGDHLFGVLSLISAFPYLGDLITKPLMGALKGGGKLAKMMRLATSPAKWRFLGMKFPALKTLFVNMAKIGPWVMRNLEKVPGASGFKDTISKWVGPDGMFTLAAKEGTKSAKLGIKAPNSASLKMFRDYGMKKDWGFFTRLWKKGGFFKNRQLSRLLKDTKFYLAFLGFIGLDEYMEPIELEEMMGEEEMNKKMEEYMETSEAKESWELEMKDMGLDNGSEKKSDKEDKPFIKKPEFELGENEGSLKNDPLIGLFFS